MSERGERELLLGSENTTLCEYAQNKKSSKTKALTPRPQIQSSVQRTSASDTKNRGT